jgi:hypothetical protein
MAVPGGYASGFSLANCSPRNLMLTSAAAWRQSPSIRRSFAAE